MLASVRRALLSTALTNLIKHNIIRGFFFPLSVRAWCFLTRGQHGSHCMAQVLSFQDMSPDLVIVLKVPKCPNKYWDMSPSLN